MAIAIAIRADLDCRPSWTLMAALAFSGFTLNSRMARD